MTKKEHIIRTINQTADNYVAHLVELLAVKTARRCIRNGRRSAAALSEYFDHLYYATFEKPIVDKDVQDLVGAATVEIWTVISRTKGSRTWFDRVFKGLMPLDIELLDLQPDVPLETALWFGTNPDARYPEPDSSKTNVRTLNGLSVYNLQELIDRQLDDELWEEARDDAQKAVNKEFWNHRRPRETGHIFLQEEDEEGNLKYVNISTKMHKMLKGDVIPTDEAVKAIVREMTPRQREVIWYAARGYTREQIAQKLRLRSTSTVTEHRNKVRQIAFRVFRRDFPDSWVTSQINKYQGGDFTEKVQCVKYRREEIHPVGEDAEEALQMVEWVINHMN